MAKIQYASGREQLCAVTLDTLAGSLAADTYYFWLQSRNDVGYNLPGPIAEITVNGSQGIALTIPEQALIQGENWLQYAISIGTTSVATEAKLLLVFDVSEITLPYTVNLTLPVHIQTERELASLPTTNLINGLLVSNTTTGIVSRYSSFSTQWHRHYDGFNVAIIDTTDNGILGCDTPLDLIDNSRHVINYDYAMDGSEGVSRRYWLFNNTTSTLSIDREIGITATIQDDDVSSLFYNLFQVVFEGYFDRVEEEFVLTTNGTTPFSYLSVEVPYSATMENLILERNLAPEQAFQFRVFPEFDITELGLVRSLLPIDSDVNLVPFLVPNQGKPTDLGELLGDVIIGNDPNLRRVYPTAGLSAFVDTGISIISGSIARVRSTSVAFGLQSNVNNQILAINTAGNVYPVTTLRANERQRALVSTLSGESAASTFSSQIEGNSNPNINVVVTYPTTIRANFNDVIAGSNKGDFNAEEIVFYVRKRNALNGAIVETRRFAGFTPTNTTSDSFSFLYANGVVHAGDIPSADFGLFSPTTLISANLTVQNTTGTFYFDFAVSFKYNGNSVTNINHSPLNGSVEELAQNLATIAENSKFWQSPVFDVATLTATAANDLVQGATYPVLEDANGDISLYTYDSSETASVDGYNYLDVTNGAGRFVRVRGTAGENGASGFGLSYNFSTSTLASPSLGQIRFNNATYSSVTQIYVSETDRNFVNVSALLDEVSDTSVLVFFDSNDPTKYAYYSLSNQVDSGAFRTLTVNYLVSNGPLTGETTFAFALKGPAGAQGIQGAQGVAGVDGISGFGLRYTFGTATTSTPPSGELRFNSATYASITEIYVSETDRLNNNLASLLATISNGSPILVLDDNDPTTYAYFTLNSQTDNGTDRTLSVSHIASSGTLAGNISLTFTARGEQGLTGATGDVSAASALTLQEQAAITSTAANEIDIVNVLGALKARLESDGDTLSFVFLELVQAFTKAQRSVPVPLTISSGVVTIDASLSNIYTLSLTANVTSVLITNLSAGTNFDLHITQDATGGRTIAGWNSAFDWAGGTAPIITATANAKDFLSFESGDGTTIKGFWAGDFS